MPALAADRSATSMRQLRPRTAQHFPPIASEARRYCHSKEPRRQGALQPQLPVRGVQRHQYSELRCADKLHQLQSDYSELNGE